MNLQIVLGLLTLTVVTNLFVEAVNLARYDKLSKEELLELDREVTDFYLEKYDQLDTLNVSYDEQILKSMRAQRHTNVLNHYDYIYTDYKTMLNSIGAKVDRKKCEIQLRALVEMSKNLEDTPLSVRDFFDASSPSAAGVLNGNFVWLGSPATCQRAKISANSSLKITKDSEVGEINARFCVAHIKSNSWPDWDKYFEQRLRIRIGICLPESCHSNLYVDSEQIRKDVDYLNRHKLPKPFNGDNYSTTYLYCLPDEDSPHRQIDLGAKLLIGFLFFWLALTLYTNIKYHRRKKLVHRLRNSVDIRMIISEKRDDYDDETENKISNESDKNQTSTSSEHLSSLKSNTLSPNMGGNMSQLSSAGPTPIPSEIEDNDGEFNVIRPVVVTKNPKKRSKSKDLSKAETFSKSDSGLDFLRAFSIQSNLNYLCKNRINETEARERHSNEQQEVVINSKKFSLSNNRISASNEALLHDFKKDKSKVAIVSNYKYDETTSGGLTQDSSDDDKSMTRKRVNVNIFDGIKVFATAYIVHGHVLMFFFGVVTDLRFATERMFNFSLIFTFNALHVVGLFYIITGILTTYLAFSRQKKKELLKPTFWILVIASRYLRLIPTYLLVFWFAKHLAAHTGGGPTWFDYRTDMEHVRGFCLTESWKTMLTMSASDVKVPYDCVPQSWYLSNDFRTLLILPFYVMILAKNVTLGYIALLATFFVSYARTTYVLRQSNVDYQVLMHWQPHVYSILADRLHDAYTDFLIRLSTYLSGCMVGHLLYMYETRQIKQWPSWFKRYGMKTALIVGAAFFMGAPILSNPYINQFLPNPKDIDSDTAALFIPLFRMVMELCICTVLLLLVTGGGYEWIRDLFSSNLCKILSNISYCVFLIHVEFMYKVKPQQTESTFWSLYIHSVFFIVTSNLISFFVHLLYEMPINNMLRYIFLKMFTFVKR